MASNGHRTHVYVGLAGEGENIAEGGMLRCAEGDGEWVSITNGLPDEPQVRALLVHPDDPAAFAAALSRLITDARLRSRLGTAGRAASRQFADWDATARSFSAAVDALTAAG